jgi:hypothetical protein
MTKDFHNAWPDIVPHKRRREWEREVWMHEARIQSFVARIETQLLNPLRLECTRLAKAFSEVCEE